MDDVVELVVEKEGQVYYTVLSSIRLTTAPRLCSCSVSRDTEAGDGWHDRVIRTVTSSIESLSALPWQLWLILGRML